jgi:hypothetical protein
VVAAFAAAVVVRPARGLAVVARHL